ncbi:helix-turn-helix transcriptional regulator [Streptomyces olivaceiscleroticus]|uniref:LuxR C-terminal-related transcriptional regulator n=1 Tax=Streptomyces olivaceiscleroticus TaxID=68245 RepID=A0ABP3JUH5_9ACTN
MEKDSGNLPAQGRARPLVVRQRLMVETFDRRLRALDGPDTLRSLAVLDAAAQSLIAMVPADVWCAVLLDPATMLDTGGQHEHGFPEGVMPRLFEIEHAEQAGADNIRVLARRPLPASLLSRTMKGEMGANIYYQDVLRPEGLADELRVVLRDGRRIRGLIVLCRACGSAPFTAADVRLAAALSAPAARSLRGSFLLSGIDRADVPDAPGLLILDGDHQMHYVSPTAERWLGTVPERHTTSRSLPLAVGAIAAGARGVPPGHQVTSRLRSSTGHWLTCRAWRSVPRDGAAECSNSGTSRCEPLTYISIGPSHPGELTAIVLDAYGLTAREREIAQLVLIGRSTSQVAETLHISTYTVQDHLRHIFDKAGVRSRRELTGELFFRHYLPYLMEPPLSKDGRMRADPQHGSS